MHRCVCKEELPFRLPMQHVAVGRLGEIYPAIERARWVVLLLLGEVQPKEPGVCQCTEDLSARRSGRVVTVESFHVLQQTGDAETESLALIEQSLVRSLESQPPAIREHRHLVCYDSIHCVPSDHVVYLCASTTAPARVLSGLLKDFGRLHPLAVRGYVRGVVQGLHTLHEVHADIRLDIGLASAIDTIAFSCPLLFLSTCIRNA